MSEQLSCGIVGLPNVGKSTLFNAITRRSAPAANYPFCTIDPNVGLVEVSDPRLPIVAAIAGSGRIIPAVITFVDIAGLVKGASTGEGLGNQFLANIRETDAIVQVVRCFEDSDVIHVAGKVDPIEDIQVIELELILADLQMCENIIGRLEKQAKGKKELLPVIETLQKARAQLNLSLPLRHLAFTEEEIEHLKPYPFLTAKKILYAANVSEKDLPHMTNPLVEAVRAYAKKEGAEVIPICAKFEEELAQLPPEEALEYLRSVGLEEPGLNRLVRAAFNTLGLITYITAGEMETRAWTIPKGMKAQLAAGKIHSDIEKGFIRAEVVSYQDFATLGGRPGAKEKGKARMEGKEYIVQDGDVILFFHS